MAPAATDLMSQEASWLEQRQHLLQLKTAKQSEHATMETNARSAFGGLRSPSVLAEINLISIRDTNPGAGAREGRRSRREQPHTRRTYKLLP